mmetsp:Transcript_48221/g.92178  ORF Transcript_48221/g.92178 Transcript_48221/m.92178 type:complete len:165 (+) Transcript_48221:87-581(+)|eukprot:CAMPEP_0114257536 /NCGR_PEP_ID=MMETSP0058-20121206/18791_1 /TAXON_ID=36894 /ORGANISM="Pyramimonas parkeae, CCMP726" /LENGTH=164 /DNA_ID=CAMNT_0001372281 /DNA_START=85 /DNA_END=579 /DNA_ORIENTATION=+
MAEKNHGTVKWFSTQKGYGFITMQDASSEIFVHQTAIHAPGFRSLREGESVEFSTEASEDGRLKAINVTGPEGAHVQGVPRRFSYRRSAAGEDGEGKRAPGRGRGRGRGRGGRARGRGRQAPVNQDASNAPPAPVAEAGEVSAPSQTTDAAEVKETAPVEAAES